jgi:transcriptional regulator with XRE-family HTH domain
VPTVGETIKKTRKARGDTQDDIAKLFGLDRSTVAAWETNRTIPDINIICGLAKRYEVTTDYLLNYPTGNPDDLAARIFRLDPKERHVIEALVSILEQKELTTI